MPSYKGTMNITAHECYQALMEQSRAEIKQKTGRELTVEELEKGYKYKVKKKVRKEVKDATVSFSPANRDRRIAVHYSLDGLNYEMNYDIKPLEEGKTELTYSQITKGEKLNFLEEFLFKSRMKRWMKAIEREMISRRTVE